MDKYMNKLIRCDKCAKLRYIPKHVARTKTYYELCDWECMKNTWDSFNKCEMYEETFSDIDIETEYTDSDSSSDSDNYSNVSSVSDSNSSATTS